jgi:predicted Ser/Thr protein kinase
MTNEEKIIYHNERKHTSISVIEIGGRKCIKKTFSVNSPEVIKQGFEKEKLVYSIAPFFAPKLVKNDKFNIVIEYIEGETLGDLIYRENIKPELLNDVFKSANKFFNSVKLSASQMSFLNLARYLSVLSFSGPVQNKGLEFKKTWFLIKLKRVLLIFLHLFCKIISFVEIKLFRVDYLQGFSHSDFHYNNIVVKDDKPNFIDFERASFDGFFYYDLIFLLVVLETVNQANLRQHLSERNKKVLLGSVGKKFVFWVFKFAVQSNKKFRKQT